MVDPAPEPMKITEEVDRTSSDEDRGEMNTRRNLITNLDLRQKDEKDIYTPVQPLS